MATLNNTLAKGITFPFQLDEGGSIVISTYEDLIKSSIRTILAWPLGTFPFLPNFGSRTYQLIGEPNAWLIRALVRRFIIDAITNNEKRITLLDIAIEMPTTSSLHVILKYKIKAVGTVKDLELTANL